eukprot:4698248-Amphidinium_carterae.1
MDGFHLFDKEWIIIVDELFRYKQAYHMPDLTTETFVDVLLNGWIRYFGAPTHIICDQGTTFASLEAGIACDKLGITRLLAGEDIRRAERGGAHTSTSLAERHIGLLKHTCMTMASEDLEEPLRDELVISEACHAHNVLLSFNGVCPHVGVFGSYPGEVMENTSIDAMSDARAAADITAKVRIMAKAATLQMVLHERFARANHSRPQQQDLSVFKPGLLIDFWKAPEKRELVGWRGPGVLLDVDTTLGLCHLKWQGKVCPMPLRLVRVHEGPLTMPIPCRP